MFERVLLCYDDSPLGRKALRRGAELAVILKTQVFVLCVVPATAPNATMVAAAAGTVCLVDPDAAYRESLAESLEALHALGLEGEGHLARGDTIDVIAAFARQLEVDLIVVGHYPTPTGRWWSGSQRAALAERVTCSGLIATDR
jgi:nucleotide-binding universal stress UspA family protein